MKGYEKYLQGNNQDTNLTYMKIGKTPTKEKGTTTRVSPYCEGVDGDYKSMWFKCLIEGNIWSQEKSDQVLIIFERDKDSPNKVKKRIVYKQSKPTKGYKA